MKQPTIEEVKEYFKDALEVRCAMDNDCNIFFNGVYKCNQEGFFYTGETPIVNGENIDNYAILCSELTDWDYAEITKYKPKTLKNPNAKHYETNSIDVIDFCKLYNLNFNRGSVVKYVSRGGLKKYDGLSIQESEIKDIQKAIDFLQRELKYLKKGNI